MVIHGTRHMYALISQKVYVMARFIRLNFELFVIFVQQIIQKRGIKQVKQVGIISHKYL